MRFLFGLSNKLGFLSSVHSIELVRFKEMWPFDGFLIGGSSSEERETMKQGQMSVDKRAPIPVAIRQNQPHVQRHSRGWMCNRDESIPAFLADQDILMLLSIVFHVTGFHLLANMYGARPLHSKHQVSHCSSWLVFALVFAYVSRG